MESSQFDQLIRALSGSRRSVLSGTFAIATGWLGAHHGDAKKKRKRKKKEKKAKPNAFGCLNVGDACQSEEQCCSGIREGKKGKRTCKAHGAGTCASDTPGLCLAPDIELLTCNNRSNCGCFRTTAGSNFCADLSATGNVCAECQTDADCLALGYVSGSACAPFSEGNCAGQCDSGMACFAPCGAETSE